MKNLLLFALLCFPLIAFSQLTFEEVQSPEDFSIGVVRKSPTGEYFVQPAFDRRSIFTSTDGQQWTRTELPALQTLSGINFFSDGTPLLQPEREEHVIRRN